MSSPSGPRMAGGQAPTRWRSNRASSRPFPPSSSGKSSLLRLEHNRFHLLDLTGLDGNGKGASSPSVQGTEEDLMRPSGQHVGLQGRPQRELETVDEDVALRHGVDG